MSDEWHQTACILCSINCGIEVQARRADDRPGPRRQGPPGESRATRARRRCASTTTRTAPHRLTSPMRRRPDGTFEDDRLGHRDRRGRRPVPGRDRRARRRQDPLLRRRRAGQPPRRRLRRGHPRGARHPLRLERARPGEDRRVLGRRPAVRPSRAATPPATTSTPRSPVFWGKNPWQSHGFPQARRDPQGDRQRPRSHADRHRPAAHRDRPTWPTSTSSLQPGRRRLPAWPRCSRSSSTRT